MNNVLADQLDESIDALLEVMATEQVSQHPEIRELMLVAVELQCQPREEFGRRLGEDLRQAALHVRPIGTTGPAEASDKMMPFSQDKDFELPRFSSLSMTPVDFVHLGVSFALHVGILAGILSSSWWVVEHSHEMRRQIVSVLTDSPYILAPARGETHGGGGGGDHDKLAASKGTAPRFGLEQIVPPAVIVRNESPKLPAEPTLIGPPDIHLPQSSQAGDPLAAILSPSNGGGSGGGIGEGQGGGIGIGQGPGIGPGEGGGLGGSIYRVGGGVSAPRPIYDPEPEYSEEARKAKYQGSVVVEAVISPDGHTRDLRVVNSLGMGLDERAIEAVRKWKFEPALKDGRPVAVQVRIEVAFRLY